MDKKNKFISFFYAIFSLPIYWLARILISSNLLNLKEDYQKISSFKKSTKQNQSVLTEALIFGEDHRFYLHFGFDPIAVIRAFWKVCIKNIRQGGSTVEQQLVRVITNKYELTFYRKFREILLATIVSHFYTKEDVLNTYLSVAYFGWQMNGIDEVYSRLQISENEITTIQACSIIARLKYPEPQKASAQIRHKILNRENHIYLKLKEKTCITIGSTRPRERWRRYAASSLARSG